MGGLFMLLTAALLTLRAWTVWTQIQATAEVESQTQVFQYELDTSRTAQKNAPASTTVNKRLSQQEMAQLSKVFNLLNLPWSEIFAELEQATPKNIAIVAMEPGDKGTVKILCESPDLDTLLVYAAALQNKGAFGQLLYSHHETNDRDPNRPARLSFELALRTAEVP